MVEIDLSPLKISWRKLKEELKKYYDSGYRWDAYFENFDDLLPDFQIFTPDYYFESQDVINYFLKLKRLEFEKKKEQLEMRKCLELIRLLLTAQHKYEKRSKTQGRRLSLLLNSDYFWTLK